MNDNLNQNFLSPSAEFSPFPFWFWNDYLTKSEITRQIKDFYDKGVMGFVIHPRKGIPKEIPYLSDVFMSYVKHAVKEATRLKMKVVLYDEAMYPSGSAHGMVVENNPEYATRALRMIEHTKTEKVILTKSEKILAIITGDKNEAGEIIPKSLKRISCLSDLQCLDSLNDIDNAFVLIESYSQGTIRGVHIDEDDGEPNAPASADLLNLKAMHLFIQITYEAYYKTLKEYFGNTVIAMFTDEPNVFGRQSLPNRKAWTVDFADYLESHGINVSDLPLLWLNASDNSHETIRANFERVVNKRLSESYYRQISQWCVDHKIALTGHPSKSDDIGLLKYFQIPGQDIVWRGLAPEDNKGIVGVDSTMGKCSSDSARHRGKRRNSNECFGCCGPNNIHWAFTADDMKWYLDWMFVRGVNLIYPHAFFYSIKGEERFGERPPDAGPNNTFWPYYSQFSKYISRMCWLMTDSYNTTPIAILCKEIYLPWEPAKDLFCNQLEFNYLEENLLIEGSCQIKDGWIKIKKQAYRILIVDSECVCDELLPKLDSFSSGGGHVVFWNQEENLSSAVKNILNQDNDCPNQPKIVALDNNAFGYETNSYDSLSNIRVSNVIKDGCYFYLVVNEGESCLNGKLQIPINTETESLALEIWDAWKGTQQKLRYSSNNPLLEIPIKLERRESKIVSVNPNVDKASESLPYNKANVYFNKTEVKDLSCGPWEIVVKSPEASPHTSRCYTSTDEKRYKFTQLTSWTKWTDMAFFTGTVCYEAVFTYYKKSENHIVLDLGEVREIASVTVNGQFIETLFWAPYSFEITDAVINGENKICVAVTNTPANEIEKVELDSGLLGPVKIFGLF